MIDRKEKMIEIANLTIPELFARSREGTIRYCEAHKTELVSEFIKVFAEIVEKARISQEAGKKGKVGYILFSHLYSSMFMRKYMIRMELLDERFYNDMEPAVSYWDAGGIYRLFEDDVNEIRQRVEKKMYWTLHEYEVDDIRYLYYPYYHKIAKPFIQAMLEAALPEEAFLPKAIIGTEPLKVSFGEYMGKAEILFMLEGRGEGDEAL